jgi:NAD(P)-dependent dehydrogenase (short-subunit alcohol dehydrogenase family)
MLDTFDLTGHVAVVTGGNSGIGLGMARGLAKAGAGVAIWARDETKNAAATAELEGLGATVVSMRCDVASEDDVEAAMAATLARFGKVDSCFANSGTSHSSPFVDTPTSEWRRVLAVNLDGLFFTFRAAARHMTERGDGGSLVATASLASVQGQPRGVAYAAAKTGVIGIVRTLAVELARHRIRANAVLPGWVDTPMTEGLFAWDRFRERVLPRMPVGRWGDPADMEAVAVYLAAPGLVFHTGDTLLLDGGYSLF